jgi:hypothetical protein
MKMSLVIATLLAPMLLPGCRERGGGDSQSGERPGDSVPRTREIISSNVLAVHLAAHHEAETRNAFAVTEPIRASIFLLRPLHVEPRRITAFLVREKLVVEEQSISVEADETREEFDFEFVRTPRPPGAYEIRFVEIARSRGKPMLLARLFLNVTKTVRGTNGSQLNQTSPMFLSSRRSLA